MLDWRNINDEKEKYAAYLCSRKWSEKRELVLLHSNGMCERCRIHQADAVHHLTYARKYKEDLGDLQAICKHCHEFTHGKSDYDPCSEWLKPRSVLSAIPDNPNMDFGDGMPNIKCPFCGYDNTHFGLPVDTAESDECNWNQGFLVIPMQCELNHEWELCIGGHKGFVTLFVRNIMHIEIEEYPND